MKNQRYTREELFRVAAALRKYRIENKLTQQNIADYLKIGRSSYTYYETAKCMPSVFMLQKLVRLYRVPLDVLLENADFSYMSTSQRLTKANPNKTNVVSFDASEVS